MRSGAHPLPLRCCSLACGECSSWPCARARKARVRSITLLGKALRNWTNITRPCAAFLRCCVQVVAMLRASRFGCRHLACRRTVRTTSPQHSSAMDDNRGAPGTWRRDFSAVFFMGSFAAFFSRARTACSQSLGVLGEGEQWRLKRRSEYE